MRNAPAVMNNTGQVAYEAWMLSRVVGHISFINLCSAPG